MSTGPQLIRSAPREERNWLPLAIAAGLVLLLAAGAILVLERQHARQAATATVAPIGAPLDPYAASLPITRLALSESEIPAGGKLTYLDGHIANQGGRTVTAVTVQVLFRNMAREVTQNETHPLLFIRMREPYIDVEPVSAAPLKPGSEKEFRLIFERVSPDWDGAFPEIRILHVEAN